ncbi:Rpn family recombination-promoting nuclease/putative transposase [Nitrincola lacisaponensis]|uniref:Rpn family recombination-promoting nuclease/putative transposase n=1 Tax=Nitrincola lacisaponensis TaxID=267850 RepID=UPI00055E2C78|nr:Rpn family recombination-promoting nuclease/putative transposase [Nitrincola lacisaponensis]
MTYHDKSYKRFFSDPFMVQELLTGFIHEEWVNTLDFSTLETVKNQFITDDFRQREDDIIWRVRSMDGWVYVYLLIEFQSRIDRFMAVRMLTYVSLLYQELIVVA